ncbi:MAG: glycosyl hydrolase-related protein [Opitutaceae bacterium]|jgi:alpha-mannosidase|nr:glycosyl hydrolase-related protein [Opitutaceae bacterium]
MLRHTALTLTRIGQLAPRLKALVYPEQTPLRLEVAGPVGRITRDEAARLVYRPARIGMVLEPYGSTFWFRLAGEVPARWEGRRVDLLWASHSEATLWRDGQPVQGLNFEPSNSTCLRPDAKLWDHAPPGAQIGDMRTGGGSGGGGGDDDGGITLEVEVACNQLNGYNWRQTPGYKERSPFVVEQVDLAVFDAEAWEFYFDYLVLADLVKRIDPKATTAWGGHLLAELNTVVNELRIDDRTTWPGPRARLKALLAHRNGTFQHEISAVGHGHIDTAWLWTLAEARRKCVRTFTSALAYAGDYPEYRFVCSQAQHYAWMKEHHPDVYERIRAAARTGAWVVTGGSWVEPDCNLPSGESLVRQFLHGQRFFQKEFGHRCRVFWNPDVFGYSGALPQIMRGACIDYFLTQKLSWNQFNKPLHHNFYWEGIDGSHVFTHFPPGDSYNAMWNGNDFPLLDVLHSANNFKDHDRTRESLLVYGYGDGGGGPTREMLEVLRRIRDLQGVPRVEQRTPETFFHRLEKDLRDAPVVTGELYFEYHRGTYTTQAAIKRDNRKAEFLLREIEMLAAVAYRLHPGAFVYPQAGLERLWRIVLLNQFHDIIPGSSIREVYEEAAEQFADFFASAERLKTEALLRIASGAGVPPASGSGTGFQPVIRWGAGVPPADVGASLATPAPVGQHNAFAGFASEAPTSCPDVEGALPASFCLFNPCAWERTALVDHPSSPSPPSAATAATPASVLVRLPGLGIFPCEPQAWKGAPVTINATPDTDGSGDNDSEDRADFILENGQLRAAFTRGGQLVSLRDKVNRDRAVVTPDAPGNQFVIYEDYPHDYDAWEIDASHLETREPLPDAIRATPFSDENGLRAGIEFTFRFGKSTLRERVTLQAHDRLLRCECVADWRERHRFLKVEFPVRVRAQEAAFEIQFGHVKRPTHFNTLHDIARFESCAHKWFDLSQPDYGAAILSESKYGCAVHGSTLRLSLLRAPTYPDPEADQGEHRFAFALYPHAGDLVTGEVVRRAWEFNCPPTVLSAVPAPAAAAPAPWFTVDSPHLVIDTIKKAEDSDALIVRLYEAHGASGEAVLTSALPFSRCARVNLLEDEIAQGSADLSFHASDGQTTATFRYRPFGIISLKLALASEDVSR